MFKCVFMCRYLKINFLKLVCTKTFCYKAKISHNIALIKSLIKFLVPTKKAQLNRLLSRLLFHFLKSILDPIMNITSR